MTHAFKQSFILVTILLLATVKINAQCSNFSNSISINAPGSTNGCFNNNPNATSNICVQYNINFSNGNASFYWGHIVSNNGQSTTTTHGPVNTSQTENYPGADNNGIVCVEISCGSEITFWVVSYSNPNGGGNNCTYPNANVTTAPIAVLPVELTDFQAKFINNSSSLSWTTSSESNGDYFEILKSEDGINKTSIGRVKAMGNSTSKKSYQFVDKENTNKITYYQLKQVDLDGKIAYSKMITVINRNENEPTIKLVNGQLKVSSNWQNYNLSVMDIMAKPKVEINHLSENSETNISQLPQGVYIVRLDNSKTQKVEKLWVGNNY